MDEHYIRAHDIIDRYLKDALSDQEQYAFEQYYFEHPEMLKELEMASAMRDALRSSTSLKPAAAPGESWGQRLLGLIQTPAWSLSATGLATVLAVWFAVRPGGPQATTPLPVVAEIELLRVRGTQHDVENRPAVEVRETGAVSITVDAGGLDRATVKGVLRRPGGSVELRVVPDAVYGIAKIALPTDLLPPGEYTLELNDGRANPLEYKFTVTR